MAPDYPLPDEPTSLIVDFSSPADDYNPINWPTFKKSYTSLLYSLTSLGSVWASTAYAPSNAKIADEFGVSSEVALLGTSLLLLGWGFGPLFWAPLSEVYGRKWPVLLPFAVSTIMSIGTATAKDIQTVLITRFFTGFFGSAPITCTGGVFVDLWKPSQRGNAIVGYTLCVCGGPITAFIQAVVLVLDVIFIDESYAPVLLIDKARMLRKTTGEWALHAKWEEKEVRVVDLAVKFGLRPLQMLATPICLAVTVYSSFIYAVFYASLASFPIIFQQTRGWDDLVGSLPFLAVLTGILAGAVVSWHNQRHYNWALAANSYMPVPEARLPPMKIASVVLAGGLFIIGWTSAPELPWIATVIGVAMMGFGYYTIFTSAINYLVDTFHRWGASALAANTFSRSVLAAILPLLVRPWYNRLGNGWAFTVLGVFAILNIPIPFLFSAYGRQIRARGKYTANIQE
ncbi:major facilitator superfamily transporter multidrug resistance [Grosmannia clavigera kw1407]|uniref:Major facilitator superfamily transporter multidrug resistance n=1 Tax=Grosmannia clavigera (strain kw1407 / UAMH 11150) TaxID=655863 RepID=F0XL59_GROCL|nr:major facilitator superfamily transporter multidrug resistance [Grosmannia clavigera kw1407]EFX01740.1 major facilitator superfamily transporter multidrug resistance [Grosmannia clavigera kw1407]